MANRFTPPEKLLPARAKRTLVKPIRWSPEEWERIETAAKRAGEAPVELVRRRVLTGLKLVAALALGLSGCVSAGNFPMLSQDEQGRFQRCSKLMEPALCGNITSDVYEGMCLQTGRKNYAAELTPRARQEWLVANGCPPSMVQPAKFVADESAEIAAPQRSPQAEAAAAAGAGAGAAANAAGKARAPRTTTDEGGAK